MSWVTSALSAALVELFDDRGLYAPPGVLTADSQRRGPSCITLSGMPNIEVNGQSIHYTDSGGPGPAIVLAPPLFLDTVHFEPLAGALAADGWRVVVFDTRGHGRTHFDGEPFAVDDGARDALALADALGIESAVFGGELFGATLALHAALLEPDRVAGLLLIGPTARATDRGEVTSLGVGVDMWINDGPKAEFGRVANSAAGADGVALMERWRATDRSQIQFAADAWLGRPSIEGKLGEIVCPAVVLHGRSELYIPLAHGQAVADGLGGPKLFEVVEGERQALSITHDPKTLDAARRLMRRLFPG